MEALVVIGALFGCIAIGVPIAYALGLAALAAAWWIDLPPEAVMLQVSAGATKFSMLTIPFFVLAGAIMAEGGMARRLVAFANALVGVFRLRGGLAVVDIVATTFLSGISGSAVADISAVGSVMIPQMEKAGYPRVFSTNVTMSASVQALLIPPSHNAVIYSLATGGTISILSLFLAGVMPGLVHRTLRTVSMVMTLIAFASAVGYVMALMQAPAKITAAFLTVSDNKYVILLLINVLLLVLGCLLDMAPAILICTPILLPVMRNFGVDPVHFGMIMMLNLGIGLCHPPIGSILFVGCAVGRITLEQAMRQIWPLYLVMFGVLMLVTYVPLISLWLPRSLGL